MFKKELFTHTEVLSFELRELFSSQGYSFYKMKTFEPYSYYLKNMDFLSSKNILYFTDRDGTLMALKPDITLSIIKNLDTAVDKHKLYYSENVYRAPNATGNFQEILQFGVEVIGRLSDEDMFSLIYLAAKSLRILDDKPVLLVSDNSIFQKLIDISGLNKVNARVFSAFHNKNFMLLDEVLEENNTDQKHREVLTRLLSLHLPLSKGIGELEKMLDHEDFQENMEYLKGLHRYLEDRNLKTEVYLDFSAPEGLKYYDRISFVGIIPGVSSEVLRGGEYSNLVKTKDTSYLASGFAIYLEKIDDKGNL